MFDATRILKRPSVRHTSVDVTNGTSIFGVSRKRIEMLTRPVCQTPAGAFNVTIHKQFPVVGQRANADRLIVIVQTDIAGYD